MNPVTQTQAIQPAQPRNEVEFIPFGAEEKIKLNVVVIQKFVAIPTKSGKLPSDTDCIKFMMLCRSRKLNPFEGDCFLQGYDGRDGAQFSLITAHQAFLKRAEVHPEFDGMESGVIVKDGEGRLIDREGDFMLGDDDLEGAWAVVHFKNRKHSMKKRLNLRTFKKPYGRWNDDPAGMIVKCAEADALRSSFPTMLGGLYTKEETTPEAHNIAASVPTMTGPAPVQPRKAVVNVTPVATPPAAAPTPPASVPPAQTAAPSEPAKAETPVAGTQEAGQAAPEPAQVAPEPSEPANSALSAPPQAEAPAPTGTPLEICRSKIAALDIPEKQLMRYLQSLKPPIARGTQNSLDLLADGKLGNIATQLDNDAVVEAIRATVV